MTPLIEQSLPYLPVIGIALAIFGVLIVVLLVLYLRRMAKSTAPQAEPAIPPVTEEPDPPPAADESALRVDEPPVLSLEDEAVDKGSGLVSLRRVLGILGRRRYRVPWYALVGASESGKSALMQAIDLSPDRRDGSAGDGTQPAWWMFDDGVVVDVPGTLFLGGKGGIRDADHPRVGATDDRRWRRLLTRIRRVRARRPLNGIILTISSEDLIGMAALSRQELLDRGRDIHRRLRDAQTIIGLRVPVYVVVTKCDLINGFTSFWSSMPPSRWSEMFGWSNPYGLDTAFLQSWIDEAFDGLSLDLFRGQVEATASLVIGDAKASGTVLFPAAFECLRQPLKTILSMVFQPTAYHEGFFMRGVWFSGALPPERETLVGALGTHVMAGAADDVATVATLPHVTPRPILVRHLLKKKIFAERAVASPLAQRLWTDARDIRVVQVSAVVVAVILCVGLAWSTVSLESGLRSLKQALNAVRVDMDQQKLAQADRRPAGTVRSGALDGLETGSGTALSSALTQGGRGVERAVQAQIRLESARVLLDALGTIGTNSLSRPFIPSSWFSSLNMQVAEFLSRGFDHVVLDAMELRLDQRARRLVYGPLTALRVEGGNDGQPASMQALSEYLDSLDALDQDVKRYNGLNGVNGVAELPGLVKTLMGIDLPTEFSNYPDLLRASLERAGRRRFAIDGYSGAAQERATQLIWQVINDLTERGDLAETLRFLAGDLYKLDVGTDTADGSVLLAVHQKTKDLTDLLAEPWWALVAADDVNENGTLVSMLARMGSNRFIGPSIQDRLTADVQGALRRFHRKLEAYESPLTGPLLVRGDSGGLVVSPAVRTLSDGISTLSDKSFMADVPTEIIPPVRGLVDWDEARLQRAVVVLRDYDAFVNGTLSQFPETLRPRVKAVADQRLVKNLVSMIAHAMHEQPMTKNWQGPDENTVASTVANLKKAVEPLALLQAGFTSVGDVVERDDLADVISSSGYALLQQIDALLGADDLYAPLSPVGQWDGLQPVTAVLFDAPDDVGVQQYLSYQRERAHRLAVDYAGPVLTALDTVQGAQSVMQLPLVRRWTRLYQEVDGYFQRRPGSTLVRLESFIRFGLAGMTGASCAERLASMAQPEATGDYFLSQRNALLEQVWARCDSLNGGSGVLAGAYTRLARLFNDRLAGRYPFADSPNANGLQVASPADIKGFFADYDALKDSLAQDLESRALPYQTRTAIEEFLQQIDLVRDFLAPLLDGKPGAPPVAYTVSIDFRVNRAFEVNANQILTWSVRSGGVTVQDPPVQDAAGTVPQTLSWHWGDPITVRLQWAKDSPWLPTATADGRPALDPPASAVFRFDDPWALITLLRSQVAQRGQFDPTRRPQPNLITFTVPTRAVGSAGPPAPGATTSPSNALVNATVFLRLGLKPPVPTPDGGKTAAAAPVTTLVLPSFPVSAPLASAPGPDEPTAGAGNRAFPSSRQGSEVGMTVLPGEG